MLFYVRRHTCADGSFEWYATRGVRRTALVHGRACGRAKSAQSEARAGRGEISHQRAALSTAHLPADLQ
jgi:hypothetical protein